MEEVLLNEMEATGLAFEHPPAPPASLHHVFMFSGGGGVTE